MGYDLAFDWVHIAYDEPSGFTETYGFVGSQGRVNLEGVRIRPAGIESDTLLVYMHPASTLQLLPVPRENARNGAHVLCAGSRYARNDTAAILEKVLLDLSAYIRHAKTVWGYAKIVLVGWSGGGSLSLFYQAQAEGPRLTTTPAGDPISLALLEPADAVVFQSAHISRAHLLADSIDPSVIEEAEPERQDVGLDIYDPANPVQAPYPTDYIARFRAAQLARMRRITGWVQSELERLRASGTGDVEKGFVTHRTLADPRWIDPALDPNDRAPGQSYLGKPIVVNNGPVGLARFSTLRAWMSQWSIDHTQADGIANAGRITVPFLAIENGADDAVPQSHVPRVFDAATSRDKTFHCIAGANHYYAGQPVQLAEATTLIADWLADRGLGGRL